jgi:hypothetical protein
MRCEAAAVMLTDAEARHLRVHALDYPESAFLTLVANQVAIAVENALSYSEIADLKNRLAQEKLYLEDEIPGEMDFEGIVGQSSALRHVPNLVAPQWSPRFPRTCTEEDRFRGLREEGNLPAPCRRQPDWISWRMIRGNRSPQRPPARCVTSG